jgi:hypothetical protein
VLSDGRWRRASDPWHAPSIGGLGDNPLNVVHAMPSTVRPLLAIWFLWTEQNNSLSWTAATTRISPDKGDSGSPAFTIIARLHEAEQTPIGDQYSTPIDRRFGACGKRAGGASITTDGGIGSFDDTAPTHHH